METFSTRLLSLFALGTLVSGSLMLLGPATAQASSTVIDGPGFKVQQHHGWFGHDDNSYKDAFGNTIEHRHGWFGHDTNRTRIFGNEATVRHGNNVAVHDAQGNPLITTRRTLFNGRETHIDGNNILHSMQNVWNGSGTP